MLNLDTCILLILLKGGLNDREAGVLRGRQVGISAIVLWELWKLRAVGKLEFDPNVYLAQQMIHRMVIWPVDEAVCRALAALDFRSDPADEIIAATSIARKIPLLTRDRRLLASRVVPLA